MAISALFSLLLLACIGFSGSRQSALPGAVNQSQAIKAMNNSAAPLIAGLSPRVHIFLRPGYRERFVRLFRDTLHCDVKQLKLGPAQEMLLVSFADGSAFSVEFSDAAPEGPAGSALDDAHAFRGAWIEFRVNDVADVRGRLRSAGIRDFTHPGSKHLYFSAPGGQVFRVADIHYQGP